MITFRYQELSDDGVPRFPSYVRLRDDVETPEPIAKSSRPLATVPLAKAGGLVDAAVDAGANSVSGPGLDVSERDALYRDALRQALADAKAKGEVLAQAAGLQLAGAQAVAEGTAASEPVPYAARLAVGAAVPVEPGTQQIDATVTVTYAATGA